MHGKIKALFITGTDTDAGKTIFCAQLLAFLRRKGINAVSQKWVQTGCEETDDAALHIDTAGLAQPEAPDLITPVRFAYPASPHLAARLEGKDVDVRIISSALNNLMQRYDIVLCEGSGGALVPLADSLLLSDYAAQLGLPAIIVSANKLGCINHTLLTVEALKSRNIPVLGIAFMRVLAEADEIIAEDNVETVRKLSGVTVLGELDWLERPDTYSTDFDRLGEAFLERWDLFDDGRNY